MLKQYVAGTAALLLLLLPAGAFGQAPAPPAQQEPVVEERRDAEVIRADQLIGQAVRDRTGERVGRIDDLALNVEQDRIAYAIVSHGGVFGIGSEQVAVSWQRIQPDEAERVVRFDGTEADIQRAQRIDTRTAWPEEIREGEPDRPVATAGVEATNVVSVSRLVGMDVQNAAGERLGQIDDVTFDRDGSPQYAVIAHGGFLGFGHDYVAVPWERLDVDARQERVVLEVTRQQLETAPQFEYRERWPASVDWPFGAR